MIEVFSDQKTTSASCLDLLFDLLQIDVCGKLLVLEMAIKSSQLENVKTLMLKTKDGKITKLCL